MEAPSARMMRGVLLIDGMRTVHCVRAVFQGLAGIPGIARAEVALGRADLELSGVPERALIDEALSLLGYHLASLVIDHKALPILTDDRGNE